MLSKTLAVVILSSIVGTHALCPYAGTHSTGVEPAGHEWQKPGPSDSRSPCPGLNALANHGWLPRNGMNISLDDLTYAAKHGYNYTAGTYDIFFNLTTLPSPQGFNLSTTGNPSTFNLEDLKAHDTIEQDGSLSRNDFYFGDDLHFSPAIWDSVAKNLGIYDCPADDGYVSNTTAAKAWTLRQEAAKVANPDYPAPGDDFFQKSGTAGTTSLYLATLWDYQAKAAPKAWIEVFFAEERIPYLEGYTTPREKDTDFIYEFVEVMNRLVGWPTLRVE